MRGPEAGCARDPVGRAGGPALPYNEPVHGTWPSKGEDTFQGLSFSLLMIVLFFSSRSTEVSACHSRVPQSQGPFSNTPGSGRAALMPLHTSRDLRQMHTHHPFPVMLVLRDPE